MHSPRWSVRPSVRRRPARSTSHAGEVAADHVAVAAASGPARHQADRDRVLAPPGDAARRLFQVQQAQVVLAALAQHDFLRLDAGVGIEPVEFLVDLALQVLGIGREPDGALVGLGPEARRRDIAERLADPGAGLCDDDMGFVGVVARLERGAHGGRVVGLLGPRLGVGAEQCCEPRARVGRRDAVTRRLARRRLLVPLGQSRPDVETAAARGAHRGRAERGDHRPAPRASRRAPW